MTDNGNKTLGFIGLGVMGEPMCRNLAVKSGQPVTAFDVHSVFSLPGMGCPPVTA